VRTLDAYFEALRSHDWDRLAECLAAGVRRTGPYMDVVEGRDAYTKFLAGVLPTLPNYTLTISRVRRLDPKAAVVELSERLDVNGVSTEFPEVLLFEFDDDERIRTVDVFVKQVPGAGGASASAGGPRVFDGRGR